MNAKKSILLIFITVLLLIFAYNYLILPLAFQFNQPMEMGMGMHGRMYSNYNNYMNFNGTALFAILILLSGLTLIQFYRILIYRILIRKNQCSHCGYQVIDEKWTICPMCGNKLRK